MHYFVIFFETCDEASLLFSKFNLLSATTFGAFSPEKKTINYIYKYSALKNEKNSWNWFMYSCISQHVLLTLLNSGRFGHISSYFLFLKNVDFFANFTFWSLGNCAGT